MSRLEKQRIFHTVKAKNYTVIDNECLRDCRLSWKARGILAYVMSLPETWRVNAVELQSHASDKKESTISGLRELAYFGYAELLRDRDGEGHFVQGWYFYEVSKKPTVQAKVRSKVRAHSAKDGPSLFDLAAPSLPESGIPVPAMSEPAGPVPVMPSLLNTEISSTDESVRNIIKESTADPLERDLEGWLKFFQTVYQREHGGPLCDPPSEKKAIRWLYGATTGRREVVEEKIQILIQLRAGDPNFWGQQPVSAETIAKFWSRLIPRPARARPAVPSARPKQAKSTASSSKASLERYESTFEGFQKWAQVNLPAAAVLDAMASTEANNLQEGTRVLFEAYLERVCNVDLRPVANG